MERRRIFTLALFFLAIGLVFFRERKPVYKEMSSLEEETLKRKQKAKKRSPAMAEAPVPIIQQMNESIPFYGQVNSEIPSERLGNHESQQGYLDTLGEPEGQPESTASTDQPEEQSESGIGDRGQNPDQTVAQDSEDDETSETRSPAGTTTGTSSTGSAGGFMSFSPAANPAAIVPTPSPSGTTTSPERSTITSFAINNGHLIIKGQNLTSIKEIRVNGNSVSAELTKISESATELVTMGLSAFQLVMGKVYNIVITDAYAATTYPVDITLEDGSVGFEKLAPLTPVQDGYILKWDAVSGTWVPAPDDTGAAATGTVTSITLGTGIVNSGTSITTTGTIAVDVGNGANKIPQFDATKKLSLNNTNVVELNSTSMISFKDTNEEYQLKVASDAFQIWNVQDNAAIMEILGNSFKVNGLSVCLSNGTGCPAAGSYVTSIASGPGLTGGPITNSGTLSVDVDNTTVEIATNKVALKNGGVTAAKLNQMGAAVGQVLKWTAGGWAPAADSSGVAAESDPYIRKFARTDALGILPETCSGNETLNYILLTDSLECTPITATDVGAVPTSRTITAGTGLLGGGNLTADRTLSVDVGTTANKIVQLDASAKLPAVDGSQLTNLPGTTQWTTVGAGINYSGGNVGIGAAVPGRLLHVAGPIRIAAAALPGTPATGDIAIDSGDSNSLKWYNGTTWQKVGTSTATGDVLNGGNSGVLTLGTNDGSDLTLETNNTARVTVDSSGNVGVGTASPGRLLHVAGPMRLTASALPGTPATGDLAVDSGDSNSLKWYNGSAWQKVSTALGDILNGGNTGAITVGTNNATDFTLETNNTARMTVDSSGYVGIGTASPGRLLDVAGPIRVAAAALPGTPATGDIAVDSGDSNSLKWYNGTSWQKVSTSTATGDVLNGGNSVALTVGTNNATDLTLETNNTARVTVDSSGNVGVGTASPGRLLHVAGPMRLTASALPGTPATGDLAVDSGDSNSLKWYNGSAWQKVSTALGDILNGGNTGAITVGTNNATDFTLETNNTARMTVDSSGYVGIGTASPGRLLDVAGPIRVAAAALPGTPSTGDIAVDSGDSNSLKWYNGTSWQKVSTSTATGDVINGGNSVALTVGTNNATDLTLETNNTARVTVDSSGNVGVGTASPGRLLHVAGPMRLTASALPGTPATGDLAVDSGDSNSLKWYNGSAWQKVSTALGDILNGGNTGAITVGTNNATDFTLETNNTARVTVDSSGNVGVGTASPGRLLDVAGPIRVAAAALPGTPATGDIAVDSGDSNSLKWYNGSAWQKVSTATGDILNGGNTGAITVGTNNATDLTLETNNTARVTVDSSGNVGVGTASPSSKLHVSGGVQIGTDAAVCAASKAGTIRYSATNVEFCNGTSWQAFGVAGSGVTSVSGTAPISVTNGTTTPQISIAAASSTQNGYLSSTDWNTFNGKQADLSAGATINGVTYPASGLQTLQVSVTPVNATDVVNKLYVDSLGQWTASGSDVYRSTGNVAIGTSTPAGKLDVASGQLVVPNGTAAAPAIAARVDKDTGFYFSTNEIYASVGGATRFRIANTILETPNTIRYSSDSSVSMEVGGSSQLFLKTNYTERITMLSGGNVGVNTTTPAEQFEVNGNVRIGSQTTRATSTNRGQLSLGSTYITTANANTTINWNLGNIQELATFQCNGTKTITFSNLKDGASYTLLISGAAAHSGTCVFSSAGYTFKASGGNVAPTASRDVLFTFVVINTTVVYNMIDNLQ